MSTYAPIRPYTDADAAALHAAALRFCKRHTIAHDPDDPDDLEVCIDYWIATAHRVDVSYRRKLWTGVFCRALGIAHDTRATIYNGHVVVKVD